MQTTENQTTARAIVIAALLQNSLYKGDSYRNFENPNHEIYKEADKIMEWVNKKNISAHLESLEEQLS